MGFNLTMIKGILLYISLNLILNYIMFLITGLYNLISGPSLLVKPITEQGGTGTTVYFPGANDVSLLEIMLLFK